VLSDVAFCESLFLRYPQPDVAGFFSFPDPLAPSGAFWFSVLLLLAGLSRCFLVCLPALCLLSALGESEFGDPVRTSLLLSWFRCCFLTLFLLLQVGSSCYDPVGSGRNYPGGSPTRFVLWSPFRFVPRPQEELMCSSLSLDFSFEYLDKGVLPFRFYSLVEKAFGSLPLFDLPDFFPVFSVLLIFSPAFFPLCLSW
jgi:hypothetical protein